MRISLAVIAFAMLACGRQAPPRDYQNAPPAMTHPVTSSAQSPAVNGMKPAAPEPSKGVEGPNARTQSPPPSPPTVTAPDTPPVSATR
ncbi:MAG TPA: hypothetical protein VL284_19005 [Thermoanaerobaculia bacterium]|nr:hypothetical protein [Thermoanaerobaculia bacterium]